jgi:hypothetical protein
MMMHVNAAAYALSYRTAEHATTDGITYGRNWHRLGHSAGEYDGPLITAAQAVDIRSLHCVASTG